jgi:enoyl-[acyl-carrier protein] reductase I
MTNALMAGKRGLIMGLANERSIAWGIAKAVAGHGAELAFSYQGEALKKRVEPLAAELGSDFVTECDVSDEASLDRALRGARGALGQARFPCPCHRASRTRTSCAGATSTRAARTS